MSSPNAACVVTFGECLMRLSPPRYERFLDSPQLTANFGGCEANVAVGLAHLGIPTSYVSVIPNNPIGDAAVAALRAEGVNVDAIVRSGDRLGLYFVELGTDQRATRVVYDRAHSSFAAAADAFAWPELLRNATWFHGSGITPALGDAPAAALASAIAAARAARVPVSIDLNYRAALWTGRDPVATIAPLVRDIDLLIGNAMAVRAMLGIDVSPDATATRDGAEDLARRLSKESGANRVALTRRDIVSETRHKWSAAIYDARTHEFAYSRTHDVRVVDRVGGGDSFAAALIACLLRATPLESTLEFAVTASAHKLTVPGDFSRLSTADVERMLA